MFLYPGEKKKARSTTRRLPTKGAHPRPRQPTTNETNQGTLKLPQRQPYQHPHDPSTQQTPRTLYHSKHKCHNQSLLLSKQHETLPRETTRQWNHRHHFPRKLKQHHKHSKQPQKEKWDRSHQPTKRGLHQEYRSTTLLQQKQSQRRRSRRLRLRPRKRSRPTNRR